MLLGIVVIQFRRYLIECKLPALFLNWPPATLPNHIYFLYAFVVVNKVCLSVAYYGQTCRRDCYSTYFMVFLFAIFSLKLKLKMYYPTIVFASEKNCNFATTKILNKALLVGNNIVLTLITCKASFKNNQWYYRGVIVALASIETRPYSSLSSSLTHKLAHSISI